MLKKKYIRGPLKVLSFAVCFAAIFLLLQPVFIPKNESSAVANQFYDFAEENLDVLFLGASQMLSGVNAQKLTEEYGISSHNFGAGVQHPAITLYYLREALKTQTPKTVMVEVCEIFDPIEDLRDAPTGERVAWSYLPMKLTSEKINSYREVTGGNRLQAAEFCLTPLLVYHSRWNSIWVEDVKRLCGGYPDIKRGYIELTRVAPQTLDYIGDEEGEEKAIPPENDDALSAIAATCEENGIALVFFKAPVARWTRAESKVVKAYMAEHGYTYLELNDHLDEIGIDPETDFCNTLHLNASGANKTTDFLANYLKKRS